VADSGALQHEYEVYIRTTPQKLWDAILSSLKSLLETGEGLSLTS
jgi:hypothetical protein